MQPPLLNTCGFGAASPKGVWYTLASLEHLTMQSIMDQLQFDIGCSALPHCDSNYAPPVPDLLKQVMSAYSLSMNDVALITGYKRNLRKGSPAVRKWRYPPEHRDFREIPYAAWRLLLEVLELVPLHETRDTLKLLGGLPYQAVIDGGDYMPYLTPFDHEDYVHPSPGIVKRLYEDLRLSPRRCALITGMTANVGQQANTQKWVLPVDDPKFTPIPYAAWRLLVAYAGLSDHRSIRDSFLNETGKALGTI